MVITTKDLQSLVYDPTRMQQLVLGNTGVYSINDPSNPFVMLVEAATTLAAAATVETAASLSRIYPSLANTESDIFHHVSDKELLNLFSHPAETNMVLYLNIRDIKSQAMYDPALKYFETYIQAGTEIMVTGIPFTLINDIHIKLYDTGSVFAEQLTSANQLANNSLGIIPAGIVSFQDSEPWLAIETTVKQLKKSVVNKTITVSEGFYLEIRHTDKYHYSDISFKNASTNNQWVPLSKTHSDSVINPDIPTAYISILNQMMIVSIPDVYLLSGQVSGEVRIELYETKGYLDLPIYKYQMSEYEVVLNTVTTDPVRATIANITVFANSRDVLNGGKNGYTFTELRDSVINNTLGHPNVPITTTQLARTVSTYGFELYNAIDLVTQRTFVASRNFVRYSSNLIQARPDVYFNTVGINTSALSTASVIVAPDHILVPSGTVFKETNGINSIVPDSELTTIAGLTNQELVTYTKNNKLFFTPYYYLIDTSSVAVMDTRVYDLDTPLLRNIKITGKNVNILPRCNVGKYGLTKTTSGYTLTITVLSNNEFKLTNTTLLKGQLSIPLLGGPELAHFTGVYDAATEVMTFDINSNFNISVLDQIELTNGVANISNVFAELTNRSTIYLYTTDVNVLDTSNYLLSEIQSGVSNITVLDREDITVEFGNNAVHVWNKMFITYTNRRYKQYTVDKPLTYVKDVYSIDPVTGSIITITTDPVTGVVSTNKTILHAAGDPVLDANGVAVFEYRKGDTVLDANNLPVIDLVSGVIRNADIMMLEYEFLAANTITHVNYLNIIRDTLKGWLFSNLVDINVKVLENTKVLYKSYKTSIPVGITTESTSTLVPYIVKPVVNIYSTKVKYSNIELANLKMELGYLLHGYLDNANVNLTDLKTNIISNIDNDIVSVKIEGVDTYRNSEVFSMTSSTSRLTPNKILQLNDSGELEVVYDIDIRMHLV